MLIDTGNSATVASGWWQNQLAISLALLLIRDSAVVVLLERHIESACKPAVSRSGGHCLAGFPVRDRRCVDHFIGRRSRKYSLFSYCAVCCRAILPPILYIAQNGACKTLIVAARVALVPLAGAAGRSAPGCGIGGSKP